ncbi:MAG TPA: hypothetical protein VMF53_13805 [Alphaproteobacteria bacterium]|nr:hypothetical protein [Alphaproteobacteria bacterium]
MSDRPTAQASSPIRLGLWSSIETLDNQVYAHTRNGFERAELAMMALLAAERGATLTFAIEDDEGRPYSMAYWVNRSPTLRTATLSGGLFLHGRRDLAGICRAAAAAYARNPFDLAWFRIPLAIQAKRVWLRTVKRPSQRRLLVVGMARASQDVLPLAETYEAFVEGLGKRTRRNVRHYRQHAADSGIAFKFYDGFLPEEMYGEINELCAKNGPKPFPPEAVIAWRARLKKQAGQFYSIVSTDTGEMISLCRGFVWGKSAVIVYQLNSRDHYEKSPSLLHRSFLIEHLIQQGVREMIFTDGCEGLLKRACLENNGLSALVMPLSPVSMFKAAGFIAARPGAWDNYIAKLLRLER